jgi:hypothetical protein
VRSLRWLCGKIAVSGSRGSGRGHTVWRSVSRGECESGNGTQCGSAVPDRRACPVPCADGDRLARGRAKVGGADGIGKMRCEGVEVRSPICAEDELVRHLAADLPMGQDDKGQGNVEGAKITRSKSATLTKPAAHQPRALRHLLPVEPSEDAALAPRPRTVTANRCHPGRCRHGI